MKEEWNRMVADSSDASQVVRFYNESRAELFEQIAWHSTDSIHHRSLVCADMAARLPAGTFSISVLVSGPMRWSSACKDFASRLPTWPTRSATLPRGDVERRGIAVRAIDLKHETLPNRGYDVITCFDVLEHVPDPLQAVKSMRDALRPGGVLFLYAPFGFDPEPPDAHRPP